MDKVEKFFRNMSNSDVDYDRLVKQIQSIIYGDESIHIIFGSGNNGKSSLVNIIQKILKNHMYKMPSNSLCATNDASYIPYITNVDYILVEDFADKNINPNILRTWTNGYSCQYRKPFTPNWSLENVKAKRLVFVTNDDPTEFPFVKDEYLSNMIQIIRCDKAIQNPDPALIEDILNNHIQDMYEYLLRY